MKRPLRILVAQNVSTNRRGGMSRMLGFLHDQVMEQGHSVDYFSSEDVPTRFQGRLARFSFPYLLFKHARKAAKEGKAYDVINVHEPHGAIVGLLKRMAGNPLLAVTTHGVEARGWKLELEESRAGRNHVSMKTRIWYPVSQLSQSHLALRSADHIFCLNFEDQAFLKDKYKLADSQITRLLPAAAQTYLDAFENRSYGQIDQILVFGTWLHRKGTLTIVEAFERLAKIYPQLTLLIMGAGFPPDYVSRQFDESVRGRLHFAPPSTEEELASKMLGAGVYWIPSLFEGTPQTMMEAMATGMPAIGTSTCGMRDIIRDGHNGFLIPLRDADALVAASVKLLDSPQLGESLGRQAHRDVVENYTWDKVAAPIIKAYHFLSETIQQKESRQK